ncbi:hypothetical protein LTR41_005790 [Exophiala xenobiotica]|nr:hypothetical protein LTR41_005790 [Exophiala xenobiotica]
MVFVDERWGDKGNMKWDAASWQERLEMCAAEGKIKDSELVIPICTRRLRHNMPGMPLRQKGCGDVYPHPSDQAVSRYPDKIAWSRGIEDTSRILLLYPHHHANPILWPTDVAENSECSVHVTTPNDLSEAHIAKGQKDPRFSSDYWNATGTESPDRLPGPVQGNRDVVANLLRIWNQTDFKQEDVMVALDWTIFVNVKDTWDFVKKQADSLDAESRTAMLAFWPKQWPDE